MVLNKNKKALFSFRKPELNNAFVFVKDENSLGCFREFIFLYSICSYFFRIEIKPLYFYDIVFDISQNLHHFTVNFVANTFALSKQFPHIQNKRVDKF